MGGAAGLQEDGDGRSGREARGSGAKEGGGGERRGEGSGCGAGGGAQATPLGGLHPIMTPLHGGEL